MAIGYNYICINRDNESTYYQINVTWGKKYLEKVISPPSTLTFHPCESVLKNKMLHTYKAHTIYNKERPTICPVTLQWISEYTLFDFNKVQRALLDNTLSFLVDELFFIE